MTVSRGHVSRGAKPIPAPGERRWVSLRSTHSTCNGDGYRFAQPIPRNYATPGFPSTPTSLGVLIERGLTVFFCRRYLATTSQIGSPEAPSATGAQPATLYFLSASIGFP